MPIETKLYRVLIASPRDVEEERKIVREEIARWNSMHAESMAIVLLPVGWETDATPDLRERGQAVINRHVDNCDLLVGIFWTRIGTPTPEAESGTIEEIERANANGKRCIIYFSNKPVPPSNIDQQQYYRLQQYKQAITGLRDEYKDVSEFREKVFRHITTSILDIVKEDKERRSAENQARITEQAIGLVTQPIRSSTFSSINLKTLADAQSTVKHLLESRFGIQDMEDAREEEISKINNVLSSPDLASYFGSNINAENVSTIVQIIETASIPSLFAISSIGKYGDENLAEWRELISEWIGGLSKRKPESGYTWTIRIKIYPSLLALYVLGISTLRSKKFLYLKEVMEQIIYSSEYNNDLSLLELLNPYNVFYDNVHKYIEPGFTTRHTPVSDHLATFIKDTLYPNEELERYLEWFDLFEFLFCLKSLQMNGSRYFGTFSYRSQTSRFITKAIQESVLNKSRLGVFISNLFNGNQELEKVAEIYDNIASNASWDFGRFNPLQISKLIKSAKEK
jgi:hypothetical protein